MPPPGVLRAAAERPPLNMRKARAGLFILEGMSTAEALIKAGYAPSTAHCPKRNGLTAEQCLLEARALDPSADPMTLVADARRAALRTIRQLLKLPAHLVLDGKNIGAITKLWDTAERYHGRGPIAPPSTNAGVSFTDRAIELKMLLDELERRGHLPRKVIDVAHRSAGHGNAE